jgi:hypothetical protein
MRRVRAALCLWLLFGFVVGTVIFDETVVDATWRYINLQGAHAAGLGPRVRMHDVMDAGIRDGVVRATIWGGGIAAAGVLAVAFARRKQ